MQKKRNSAQRMYALMEEYERSSLKQREFCDKHGLKKSTFGYWLRKYRMGEQQERRGFVPLQVRDTGSIGVEVISTTGIIVRFDQPVPAAYLRELLGVPSE